MEFVLLLSLVSSTLFESALEQAFIQARVAEWDAAGAALDQAAEEDPTAFAANNLHYLRGRIAANQKDWARARSEFARVAPGNPLNTLAVWHMARAAAALGDDLSAEEFLSRLPADFPADLKMQIARSASETLALKIYDGLSTRDARFERARLRNDQQAFWVLLRDRNDDIALRIANLVAPRVSTARERIDVGNVFLAHRQFEQALSLFETAAIDELHAAEARYQIARGHFLNGKYHLALESYQEVAKRFAGTDWEKDSKYQIASCYWRLGDYRNSEITYLEYIRRYSGRQLEEGAIRNLVDVYRALGENQKALTWLDRTLAKRVSTATRHVFLFTKAKILYSQGKYAAALQLFQQLGRLRLRPTAGGTTAEEVRYFQAMCQSKLGNKTAANAIWRRLAANPFSYYGQRSAAKLGTKKTETTATICAADSKTSTVEQTVLTRRRSIRAEPDALATAVSELSFLQLWDEASLLSDRPASRADSRTIAQLAYVAGRYHRSIAYANRLSKSESDTLTMLYPAGFRQTICASANSYNVDPLWLHAIIWQESKYNPNALSAASARGLMQFIPDTATQISAAIGIPFPSLDRLYEPEVSIQMGAHYWSSLLKELDSPAMALAAYNGGIDNVRRWKSKSPDGDEEFFVADIGFVETKTYVMAVYAARAAYGSLGN